MKNKTSQFKTILDNAIYNNSYMNFTPWSSSIGFRTTNNYYREGAFFRNIAEEFIASSRTKRDDLQSIYSSLFYYTDIGKIVLSLNGSVTNTKEDKPINLHDQISLKMSLEESIVWRRSSSGFSGQAINLSQLSTILKYANGISSISETKLDIRDKVKISFRTHPSAGGTYPIDLYVGSLNTLGLEDGIYFYEPKGHFLVKKKIQVKQNIIDSFLMPEKDLINNASLVLFFVGKPWKIMKKYGNRGLKFMYIEAGTMAQNINLATTALKLGSLDCASFCDEEINNILDMDGCFETFFHASIIGGLV